MADEWMDIGNAGILIGLVVLSFLTFGLIVLTARQTQDASAVSLESSKPPAFPTVSKQPPTSNYGIIVDAGSSGSRVMLYQWNMDASRIHSSEQSSHSTALLPVIHKASENDKEWQFKQEPGISSFASNVHGLKDYLKPPLDFALQRIPKDQHKATPIYLYATAGMRLLPNSSQIEILTTACTFIQQNYPFYVSQCEKHFRVISGEMEGIYGWLTVNYLKQGLADFMANSEEFVKSFGFLDMVKYSLAE